MFGKLKALFVVTVIGLAPVLTPAADTPSAKHKKAMDQGADHHAANAAAADERPSGDAAKTRATQKKHKEAMDQGTDHHAANAAAADERPSGDAAKTRATQKKHKEAMDQGADHHAANEAAAEQK